MHKQYATALTDLLLKGLSSDEALQSIRAVLTKKGHLRLYRKILMLTLEMLKEHTRATIPKVRVARTEDITTLQKQIASALAALHADEEPTIVVDTTIVGGYIIEHAHRRVDHSQKRALQTLYSSITKS